jgi:hypothetical protein
MYITQTAELVSSIIMVTADLKIKEIRNRYLIIKKPGYFKLPLLFFSLNFLNTI